MAWLSKFEGSHTCVMALEPWLAMKHLDERSAADATCPDGRIIYCVCKCGMQMITSKSMFAGTQLASKYVSGPHRMVQYGQRTIQSIDSLYRSESLMGGLWPEPEVSEVILKSNFNSGVSEAESLHSLLPRHQTFHLCTICYQSILYVY
jgi:hypothetical protein